MLAILTALVPVASGVAMFGVTNGVEGGSEIGGVEEYWILDPETKRADLWEGA